MRLILDSSNIVYGGYYGSPNYRISGFPMGGIRKFMGLVNSDVWQSDIVICFDGAKTIKKELLPRYKAGRVPNYAVIAQLDLLREILNDCGIPYYWDEQYEADDFICSVVHFLASVRDTEDTFVYSDDRDLACCISDKVSLKNVTSNGTCIDMNNFEELVVKGTRVPYNTILLHKMMFGDSSDNYTGLSIPGLRFDEFARIMVEQVGPFVEDKRLPVSAYMMYEVLEIIVNSLPETYGADSRAKLLEQGRIVFPQIFDVTANGVDAYMKDLMSANEPPYRVQRRHIKSFSVGDFNQKKFDFYCNILNLNKCRPNKHNRGLVEEEEEFKNMLSMRAKDLASGVLAVERYHNRKAVHAEPNPVQNMALPL